MWDRVRVSESSMEVFELIEIAILRSDNASHFFLESVSTIMIINVEMGYPMGSRL